MTVAHSLLERVFFFKNQPTFFFLYSYPFLSWRRRRLLLSERLEHSKKSNSVRLIVSNAADVSSPVM